MFHALISNTAIHIPFLNIRSCVECNAFGTGPYEKNCTSSCEHLKVTVEEKLAKRECQVKDSLGCRMIFSMTEQDGFDKYFVKVLKDRGKSTVCNCGLVSSNGGLHHFQ